MGSIATQFKLVVFPNHLGFSCNLEISRQIWGLLSPSLMISFEVYEKVKKNLVKSWNQTFCNKKWCGFYFWQIFHENCRWYRLVNDINALAKLVQKRTFLIASFLLTTTIHQISPILSLFWLCSMEIWVAVIICCTVHSSRLEARTYASRKTCKLYLLGTCWR